MDRRRLLSRVIVVGCLLGLVALRVLADQGGPVYTAVPTYPSIGGACTTGRVQARTDTGDMVCCVASQWAACGSAIANSGTATKTLYAPSFIANAGSGATGFALGTNYSRLDLGAGASDYLYSDGTVIYGGATLATSQSVYSTNGFYGGGSASAKLVGSQANSGTAVGVKLGNSTTLSTSGAKIVSFYNDNGTTEKAYIDYSGLGYFATQLTAGTGHQSNSGWYRFASSGSLPTCAAGDEGAVYRQAGGTTGARTRLCLCTSDGAGSPTYAWQSIPGGTVGDATTCNP